MLLSHRSGRWVSSRTVASRAAAARLTGAIREHLAGVRILRLFGRTDEAAKRVGALSEAQASANLRLIRLRAGLLPVYTVIVTAGIVFVVWQGGSRVVAGAMTLGSFVAFLELYLRFVNRGFRVPQLVNSIQSGAAAYSRLKPLMARAIPVRGEPRLASFAAGYVAGSSGPSMPNAGPSPGPLAVTVTNVTFRYPGALRPALRDVTLDIPAGAMVAVTGPVGSGKSALARALCGIYPVEAGSMRVDGREAAELSPQERQVLIGYLPQDPHLFSGTVSDNVMFGRVGDEDEAALQRAITAAALAEDIEAFPAGMETQVGELGIRVSGGQRQRIGLARAVGAPVSRGPGLLVLDEPFSAVDLATEARIVHALRDAFGPAAPPTRRATVVICSHRLGGFPYADRVVVLESGQVVEQGSHSELMGRGGVYSRIFAAQMRVGTRVGERAAI
jgi:ATP-binding cassette subfamily B protein